MKIRHDVLRNVWRGMNHRCYNNKHISFHNYGARGITVCDEWRNDFIAFYNWCMANGYEKGLQIDRRENDGNYTPDNCRFVTRKFNNNNTRKTIKLTFKGITLSISEWSEKLNLSTDVIYARAITYGMPVEKALTMECKVHYKPIICLNTGKRYESLAKAAKELNVHVCNISRVLHNKVKTTGGYSFKFV